MNITILLRQIFDFLKKYFFDDKDIDFDDAFLFLRLITYDLWYNKYLIVPKLASLLYQTVCYSMCLLYLYHFFDVFSSINLTNYSTALVAIFYALVTTTLSFVYHSDYKRLFKKLHDISWPCRDGTSWKQHQKKTNLAYKSLILFMILPALYIFYDANPFSSSRLLDELYLTTKLFHECFYGPVGYFLYTIHWMLGPIVVYAMVVESGITLYYSEHLRTQFHLLCEDIEQRLYVDKGLVSECHLSHCENYQNTVYRKLCFYIDRYLVLKRFIKANLQVRFLAFFTVHAVLGLMVLVCSLFFTLNEIFNPSKINNIKIWIYVVYIDVATCVTLYIFWKAGQTILDSSGRVFHVLTLCPWHIWTPKNRRVLATFLLNAEKADGISIGGVYTFNFNLFIRFFRSAYSMTMILFRLRIKNL